MTKGNERLWAGLEVREVMPQTVKERVKVEVPETAPLPVLFKAKLVSLHVVETTERFMGMRKYLEEVKAQIFGNASYRRGGF